MDGQYGIMFHHFHDDGIHIKCQGSLDKNDFENVILKVLEKKVILSAAEWKYKKEKGLLKENELCLTFDDALLCQFEIALPVLNKYHISAFWFLYTSPLEGILERLEVFHYFRFYKFHTIYDFYNAFFEKVLTLQRELHIPPKETIQEYAPENYLSEFTFYTKEDRVFRYLRDYVLKEEKYNAVMELLMEDYSFNIEDIGSRLWVNRKQIVQLQACGQIIGLHSHTHPTMLSEKSLDGQMIEYKKNKDILEDIIKTKIDVMSHPCNSYNKITLNVLKELGIKIGFRSNFRENFNGKLECPRVDHVSLDAYL